MNESQSSSEMNPSHQVESILSCETHSHLFGLVEAVLVAVGEVESCEFLAQFLLRAGYHVQSGVQFNVTGTLRRKEMQQHHIVTVNLN